MNKTDEIKKISRVVRRTIEEYVESDFPTEIPLSLKKMRILVREREERKQLKKDLALELKEEKSIVTSQAHGYVMQAVEDKIREDKKPIDATWLSNQLREARKKIPVYIESIQSTFLESMVYG
jgi:hypothetical protein